ncbi:MAG TPA: hypothetical protein VHX90_07565 [Verrucomicrobiae bacterium]|nr:hypothetical protein [Verrucomicrobiae bacterium]
MNLEEFIRTQIESVDDLRALLMFHASPQVEWDTMVTAVKLYIQPDAAAAVLARLAAKGFLVASGGPNHYRFQPQSQELSQLVRELAELDRQRPVTLINMIYARREDLQAFADAFKIKKED